MSTDLTTAPKPAVTRKGIVLRVVTIALAAFMVMTGYNGYRDQQEQTGDTVGYRAPVEQTEHTVAPRPEIKVPVEAYRDTAEQMTVTGKSSLREIAETNGVDTAKMERQAKRLAAKVRGNAPALLAEARKVTEHGKSAEQVAEQAQTLIEGILR